MSSSSGSSKLRRKEREWKPRMKERGGKATVSESNSSLAAQRAVANIKDLDRLRDRGQDVDSVVLAKISQSLDSTPAETPSRQRGERASPNPSNSPSKKAHCPLLIGLVCGGGMLLVAAALLVFGSARYSVAGTMLLEQKPLAGIELQFHASNGSFAPSRVTTSDKGDFSIVGLPAGIYRVTLQPDVQSGVEVPLAYKKLESTPLRMTVQRNMKNVSLYALQPKRR